MSEHKLHIEKGGLINKEKLFAYLRNELNETEKLRIEKLIAQDPFLQDAVDGIRGADINTVENALNSIFAKVDSATSGRKTNIFSANIRKYAAAASIILFLGMSWVIIDNLNKKQQDENEIASQQTIIKADKNSEAFILDDSSDMGSGSASSDSISMEDLKKESAVYYNRSKTDYNETETEGKAMYDFGYADNGKPEKSVTTEMIITPPIIVEQDALLSTTEINVQEVAEAEKMVVLGEVITEPASGSKEKNLDDQDGVFLKKNKKIKDNTTKSEDAATYSEEAKSPALRDTLAPIFTFVEQMPVFPGGTDSLNMFIFNNFNTGCEEFEDCGRGNIFVKFIVNEDGSISNAQIVKSVNPEFDEEVLRVISIMPKWIPGKQKDIKVRVWYTLKVRIEYK